MKIIMLRLQDIDILLSVIDQNNEEVSVVNSINLT
jgi:hypothetical protein